jgi:GAF domain-containing protein
MIVDISELVNAERNPAGILDHSTALLVKRCNLVGATAYLLEDGGRTATLHAAAGDAAGRLLDESRVVKVGERSLLGWCLESGEPQIRQDSDYLFHPTVPESRSALAISIRAGGNTVGAIELHAASPNAFDAQLVTILDSATTLIGLALENLERNEAGEFLAAEVAPLGRAAWSDGERESTTLFAEYHAADVPPWSPDELFELVEQNKVLAVPLRADGNLQGRLLVEVPDGETSRAELDVDVLARIAQQVGVALESAQVFEHTRRRAVYGQLMTEMSARVRSSLDPDTILKTAVRELGRALGAKLTTVEVNTPGTNGGPPDRSDAAEPREVV